MGLRPYWLKDLQDGSWLAVITKPTKLRSDQKARLREDARQGRDLDPEKAVIVRVVDYTVPDRRGDHICLVTTILDPAEATAQQLAACYHERREAETGSRTVHRVGRPRNRNPERRLRTYPRSVKRPRRSSYRERRPSDKGIRHTGPPTVQLLTRAGPRPARSSI